jgi:putative glutamine amidotransferase
MAPVIAITTYREQTKFGAWDVAATVLPAAYADAIAMAGGTPMLLPSFRATPRAIGGLVDRIDGLVLSGGADPDPAAYGQDRHPETSGVRPERDHFEFQLLRAFLEADRPVLGICRGMELLNIVHGGTLEQHLPDRVGHCDHRRVSGRFALHSVRLADGSRIRSILDQDLQQVCSYHHQGIGDLGEGLEATAWARDGTIEGIEAPQRRFAIGVLWHPEAGDDHRLFDALVADAEDDAGHRSAWGRTQGELGSTSVALGRDETAD